MSFIPRCSEESDDKLSKSKNDSAGKTLFNSGDGSFVQTLLSGHRLNSLCVAAADDFGSDEEDNDFGEEEDEDGGSDYDDKRGKKSKKAKPEKPGKRGPKRKRAAGKQSEAPARFCLQMRHLCFIVHVRDGV